MLRANPGLGNTPAAAELRRVTDEIARSGATPLAVARDGKLLGAVALKDVVAHATRVEYLRIVVRNLRQKLEADPARPMLIRNEPGVGYRLVDQRPAGRSD